MHLWFIIFVKHYLTVFSLDNNLPQQPIDPICKKEDEHEKNIYYPSDWEYGRNSDLFTITNTHLDILERNCEESGSHNSQYKWDLDLIRGKILFFFSFYY